MAWARALPESPEAAEALASVLEATSDLADTRPEEHSGLAMILRARKFAQGSSQRLRLAVSEVRLLAKLEDFAGARRLADSLLGASLAPEPWAAARLAGLAALTGRVHRTAQLLAQAADDLTVQSGDRQVLVRPIPLARAAFALRGYAALGDPTDSVRALARRVDQLVDASIEPNRQETMRHDLMDLPREWAYPVLGATAPQPGRRGLLLSTMQWALTQGDTNTIRASRSTLRAIRADLRPGDVAITGTYLESRVLLAIGDSVGATRLLDGSLDALSTLGSGLLANVDQAASLVRAMVLRAELAERAGDKATARRWGAAVAELWSGADDAAQQQIVGRMLRLAGNQ
jgi:hypothetical protein